MEKPQETSKDLKAGMDLVMLLIFSVTRSVTLYSRMLGSTGPYYFLIYWIGVLIQAYYCHVNVIASGRMDAMPFSALLLINFAWLMIHIVKGRFNAQNGERLHSFDPGIGVLAAYSWTRSWRGWQVNVVSDIVTALNLGGFFFLTGSPVLGSWYVAMIVWILIEHLFLYARDTLQMQRMHNAKIETQHLSDRLKQRQSG